MAANHHHDLGNRDHVIRLSYGVPVATWSPCWLRATSPISRGASEAKLAVLLRVAATMISWTILW
jgi:hypothetical protein